MNRVSLNLMSKRRVLYGATAYFRRFCLFQQEFGRPGQCLRLNSTRVIGNIDIWVMKESWRRQPQIFLAFL
jgi:hypothetical protein